MKDAIYFAPLFDLYKTEFELEQEVVRKFAKEGAIIHQLGTCALQLCYLATGRADFMYDSIAKRWDYAAGKLIVEEAGGTVRVRDSQLPDSFEIVASNTELQEIEDLVV